MPGAIAGFPLTIDMQDRPVRGRGSQRPCDFCRIRKKRCQIQGGLPCTTCHKAGHPCTFRDPTTRQLRPLQQPYPVGSPTNNTTTPFSHESPTELIQSEVLPAEWLQPLQIDDEMNAHLEFPNLFNWNAFGPDNDPNPIVLTDTRDTRETRHDDSLSRQLQRNTSVGEGILDEGSENFLAMDDPLEYSISFLGPSAELDPSLRRRYAFSKGGAFQAGVRTFRRSATAEHQNSMFAMTPRIAVERLAESIGPPPPNQSVLSQFDGFKPNLRTLFDRFVKVTYPVPVDFLPESNPATIKYSNSSSAAVAAMIYTLALPWRTHDSKLPWSRFEGNFERAMPPDASQIHSFVWQCISRDMYGPSYATIQAGLLFLERSKPRAHFYETPFDSCVMASVVTLSFAIGLHRDPTGWDLVSAEAKEHRRWLWWLVYVQERWKCAVMGTRMSIREDDFDTPKPELGASILYQLDSPMLSTSVHNADAMARETHFDLLLSLTDILDQILKFMNRHNVSDISTAFNTAVYLERLLTTWRTTMLRALSLLENLSASFAAPTCNNPTIIHFGNLKIAYIYCGILIYRVVLQLFEKSNQVQTQTQSAVLQEYHSQQQAHAKAMAFLDLVEEELNSLTLVDFSLFWFSWSRAQLNAISDFLVLLYVSAPTAESKARMRVKIEKHRHWLWVHSNHIHFTRVGLVRLDSMLSATEAGKLK